MHAGRGQGGHGGGLSGGAGSFWARFTCIWRPWPLLMPHRLGALLRTERPALQVLRGGFLVASTAFSFAALERLALRR